MKPLPPWRKPLLPSPADKHRRHIWWERIAFYFIAGLFVAAMWNWK